MNEYDDYEEPVYSISIVAKKKKLHPQTLRQYEKEGLLNLSRDSGKRRLYSRKNLDQIDVILALTRDYGVNIAGVGFIMGLKNELIKYEEEMDRLKKKINSASSNNTISKNKRIVKKRASKWEVVLYGNSHKV